MQSSSNANVDLELDPEGANSDVATLILELLEQLQTRLSSRSTPNGHDESNSRAITAVVKLCTSLNDPVRNLHFLIVGSDIQLSNATVSTLLAELYSLLNQILNNNNAKLPMQSAVVSELKEWLTKAESTISSSVSPDPPAKPSAVAENDSKELTICPLEHEFLQAVRPQKQGLVYSLPDFVDWAWRENEFSDIGTRIGPVQAVYLFRERSTIHHEYAVFSFLSPTYSTAPHSYVRVERAANMRTRWFMPRLDSFGPILGGAQLRESISFSTSLSALRRSPDDEIASVQALTPLNIRSKDHRGIRLHEFAWQLRELSRRSNQYKLFTVNCRWFSRQCLTSAVETMITSSVPLKACWHGESTTLAALSAKLKEERFGGKSLTGRKAIHIRARILANLGWQRLCAREWEEGVQHCREGLSLLAQLDKTDVAESGVHLYLVGGLEDTLAVGLRFLFKYDEALEANKRACAAASKIRTLEPRYEKAYHISRTAMGKTLGQMGRFDEACALHQEHIQSRREVYALRGDDDPDWACDLASALHNYEITLSSQPFTPNLLTERLATLSECISLFRTLSSRHDRKDLYRNNLSNALSDYATVLHLLDRDDEALGACEESLALRRILVELDPINSTLKLPFALCDCLTYAVSATRWARACELGEEAVTVLKGMVGAEKGKNKEGPGRGSHWDIKLARATDDLAYALAQVGRLEEAFGRWEEGVSVFRRLGYVEECRVILANMQWIVRQCEGVIDAEVFSNMEERRWTLYEDLETNPVST